MGETPEQFGARKGRKWPAVAIRRFLLYDVFLHELGHLQLIDRKAPSDRLKFAREKRAQEFAIEWCNRLWAEPFPHPNPVHNPPTAEELAVLDRAVETVPCTAAPVSLDPEPDERFLDGVEDGL
jgi:hypothetical protein